MSNYKIKMDWVESKRINNVGIIKLNHENPLNPLSAGFVEAIYTSCKKLDEDKNIKCISITVDDHSYYVTTSGEPSYTFQMSCNMS